MSISEWIQPRLTELCLSYPSNILNHKELSFVIKEQGKRTTYSKPKTRGPQKLKTKSQKDTGLPSRDARTLCHPLYFIVKVFIFN